MNTNNPYSSPSVDSSPVMEPSELPTTLGAIAKRTFLAWEKLRLVYNTALGVVAGIMVVLDLEAATSSYRYLQVLVEGALGANICYFAGPVLDTYVTWLGLRGRWFRILLFVVGTLFSCLLAIGILASKLIPDMD